MRTLIFLLLFLLTTPVWAQNSSVSPEQLLELVQQRFNTNNTDYAVHNVEANFYQKAHIASLDRTQTGRGTMSMLFDHGDDNVIRTLFHWHYTVPSKQQVISDSKTLWVYMPDNNQVMVSEVNNQSYYSEDPLLFLRNLGKLSNHFSVVWGVKQRNNEGDYLLQLTPQRPSVYIKTLTLAVPQWLANATPIAGFPLHRATVLDPTGNTTQIEFRKVKINQNDNREQFTFAIPEGVEIVRPSDLTLDFK
ncbi:MAG: outer membrane lipoprotein carrier protein LolA [Thermodesulfobacteriota bacterium]|nr:outer membrane lipoprotein carrier protein LolA [Thermodesulfobacteriota bacterium]